MDSSLCTYRMETKTCEFCNKLISDVSIHRNTRVFCDDECLQDYCKEFAEDYGNDDIHEPMDRNDLD